MTFAADFIIPGDFIGFEDKDLKKKGTIILPSQRMFQVSTICDAITMYSSTKASFILLWSQLAGHFHLAMVANCFTLYLVGLRLLTMYIAFMDGLYMVVVNLSWLT